MYTPTMLINLLIYPHLKSIHIQQLKCMDSQFLEDKNTHTGNLIILLNLVNIFISFMDHMFILI